MEIFYFTPPPIYPITCAHLWEGIILERLALEVFPEWNLGHEINQATLAP